VLLCAINGTSDSERSVRPGGGRNSRDHLSRAILHLSQDRLREQQVYTCTGWRSDGDTTTFLCADDAGVTLELERALEHYHLPAAPTSTGEARAAEEGLLEAEEGRSTVTIRVDSQVHRVLRLRRAPLEKLWGEK
jgi:hypothetical protein